MSTCYERFRLRLILIAALAAAAVDPVSGGEAPATPAAVQGTGDRDAIQDVIFLGETRPIFLRLHVSIGGKGFRAAWLDTVRSLHADLDRDGDGKLTSTEVDGSSFPGLVRAMSGGAATAPRIELDLSPKDGVVSVEELADALRAPLGPFGVQVGRVASQRTDALFGQLDHDGDGTLTAAELDTARTMLSKLDLDEDEQIGRDELEPFSDPMTPVTDDDTLRRGRFAGVPPVVELTPEDPSFRPVRLLLRKYDKPARPGTTAGDSMLSRAELGIDPREFTAADADGDGLLDTEELRRFLSQARPELEVHVTLPAEENGAPATIGATGPGGKPLPPAVKVERLSPGDVEIALGEIRLEFHAGPGDRTVDEARQFLTRAFQAADADANNYVEKSEVARNQPALAALFDLIDRDSDGKLYPKELDAFLDRQARSARSRTALATADQGRAIFAILDLNRDAQLGPREIRGALARVMSWDQNKDGRIGPDEIPHHYQFTIGRGQVSLPGVPYSAGPLVAAAPIAESQAPGPSWFRKMDHNRDGDVSRREFFGPVTAFERLDRDRDGLIDAKEAAEAK